MHLKPTNLVLSGRKARNTWRLSRFVGYASLGAASGFALAAANSVLLALYVGAAQILYDTRLKDLCKAIEERKRQVKAEKLSELEAWEHIRKLPKTRYDKQSKEEIKEQPNKDFKEDPELQPSAKD